MQKQKIRGRNGKRRSPFPLVGIRLPSWAGFTRTIYRGILKYMRLHGQWQIETRLDSTNEMKPSVIDSTWQGDGLILFRYSEEEANAFLSRNIPVINVSSECLHPKIPTVIPNNNELGTIAAEHLLSLGFKQFAFWGDPTRNYSKQRGRAFMNRIASGGYPCREIEIETAQFSWHRKWERLHEAILVAMENSERPVAVFAKDVILAANIINACSELGISVPDEVVITGANEDELFCNTTTPPMTCVQYPGEAIGYKAAGILDRMMNGEKNVAPLLTEVPIQGISIRESTNTLAIRDRLIAETVHRIRQEAPSFPLQVCELLENIPMSRAGFNKRFQKAMGIPPKSEIIRVRLQHLKSLLKTTSWSIKEISIQMQFDSSEELGRFFRRETGMTATEFRKKPTLVPSSNK